MLCGTTRPLLRRDSVRSAPKAKPPTCAKKATPPPFADGRGETEVPLDELVEEPAAQVHPGRDLDEEDEHQRPDPCRRVEDEEGAEDRRDRAARAEVRDARRGRRAEEQGHGRLRHRRDEAAGEVEGEVAEVAERVLDVLAEDREEEHVAEDVAPASVHEHRGEPADRPTARGPGRRCRRCRGRTRRGRRPTLRCGSS